MQPGVRIGLYEITGALGAGGMGEVYRARDPRLGREVALKVLPEAFALDPDRVARFKREAQVLASLNHPNIAAIYGFEEGALVLELVEGPTLADRIAEGPLPLDEALPIARQIADALEAAHEHGVIHRDLKPANIKLRPDGTVKVLDFGLAKAMGPDVVGATHASPVLDVTASPTITSPAATRIGMILGTAAYMSPEQARGKPVDKRSDIWAFGCVLYEMLTGARAFGREEITDTLADVLKSDPDWDALPSGLPLHVTALLTRCLDKHSRQRIQSAGDVRLILEGVLRVAPASSHDVAVKQHPFGLSGINAVLILGATIGGIVLTGLAAWRGISPPQSHPSIRIAITLPASDSIDPIAGGVAVSADGASLVYTAERNGVRQLFWRRRDGFDAQPLAGTEGAQSPFFAPDGRSIGFFAEGALKRIDLAGGAPVTLCRAGERYGGAWTADGRIIFASGASPALMEVSATGGEPGPLTRPSPGETHHWPDILPDGRGVLFTVSRDATIAGKQVALLDERTGTVRVILDGTGARYTDSGHIVFGRTNALWAAAFDVGQREVIGQPVRVVEGVRVNNGAGWAHFAVARDGTLAYLPSESAPSGELVWVDRTGRATAIAPGQRTYTAPRISPDGRAIAVTVDEDVWVYEFARGVLGRVTTSGGANPAWTPDATHLTFDVDQVVYRQSLEPGSRPIALLPTSGRGNGSRETLRVGDITWSPDGRVFAFSTFRPGTRTDIWIQPLDGAATPVLATPFSEHSPAFSPDGRWMAYVADQSGGDEVYVQRYPQGTGRIAVSRGGGREPLWSRGGQELFFRGPTGAMMVASVHAEPDLTVAAPRMLFEGHYEMVSGTGRSYDISPDGERFAMIRVDTLAQTKLHVIHHWFDDLRRTVPVP